MRRVTIYMATLLAALSVCAGKVDAQMRTPEAVVSRVQASLQAFKASKSIRDLQAAADTLEAEEPDPSSSVTARAQARNTMLHGWLGLFEAIDQNEDPTFNLGDMNQLAALSLTPPLEADGTRMPSGADPSDIKDPIARAAYQKEIDENNKKGARVIFQSTLRNIDQVAMAEVRGMLSGLRPPNGEDVPALTGLINGTAISSVRKARLKQML